MIPTNIYGRGIYIIQVKIYKEETNKFVLGEDMSKTLNQRSQLLKQGVIRGHLKNQYRMPEALERDK